MGPDNLVVGVPLHVEFPQHSSQHHLLLVQSEILTDAVPEKVGGWITSKGKALALAWSINV